MTSDTNSISEKVKKLLRLAGCKAASPAEAALALERAQDLILRHQIDIASLNLDENMERIVTERIVIGRSITLIKRLVVGILINYFPVRSLFEIKSSCHGGRNVELVVMGFESDVTMAGYVFHFLVGACSRAVRQFAKEEREARRKVTKNKNTNFINGWMWGAAKNLRKPDVAAEALTDSRTALILSERRTKVDAQFADEFPTEKLKELKEQKYRENWRIVDRGFKEGKNTSIAQPLANSQKGTLLLT